jgi:hypothetical protein
MIRRLLIALASVPLALGVMVAFSPPASAHNHDNNSAFYCAYWRPSPIGNYILAHSVPIYLDTQTVIYRCEVTNLTDRWQFDVWVSLIDGSSARSNVNFCEPGSDPTPCAVLP